ncbi:hypothetical protein MPF19_08775 [Polaribacter sp. Z014]|uniref:hypothetical protein n=1 Tax=Polaribacter sp. Z014 TaxID=2927126 RepID=UPI0020208BD8|nr:hypothetical protein [Polaribacter sp. Z014]MCL7763504.1 hypothetical protein [Polaribacter sp. Z014]
MRVKNVKVSVFNINKRRFMFFSLLSLFFFLASCQSEIKDNGDRFKKGVFEIPAGKGYSKTTVIRKDSLQIEEYEKIISISNDSITTEKRMKHIDTLYIKWKNNFFYSLKMKSPKKELDKDPIYVQITKVTDSSYNFTAKIGFSKFKQNGTVYKVK